MADIFMQGSGLLGDTQLTVQDNGLCVAPPPSLLAPMQVDAEWEWYVSVQVPPDGLTDMS